MATVQDRENTDGPVLSTMEARQGRRGKHVLWVLIISMALIVVGYGVLVIGVQGTHLSKPGGQTTVTSGQAAGFQAPPSQPRQSENPQTTTLTPGVGTDGKGL